MAFFIVFLKGTVTRLRKSAGGSSPSARAVRGEVAEVGDRAVPDVPLPDDGVLGELGGELSSDDFLLGDAMTCRHSLGKNISIRL
jgi:hypothetical protein